MAEIKKYLDAAALGTLVDQIKSEDAKGLAAAKKYADELATNYDAAGSAASALTEAKGYTDALANGQVKTNKEDIATLKGEGEGSVKKAVADAKSELQGNIDGVDAKAIKNAQDIAGIVDAETGILKQAKDYADGEIAKVQGEVDALEEYVGTIPSTATAKNIVAYVQEKTAGIATDTALEELTGRVATAEVKLATAEGDIDSLEGRMDTAEGAISKNAEDIAAEKSRAEGIEAGLESRLAAVEGDYLKGEDKTELQDGIDAVNEAIERLTNGVSAEEIDGVNDLINYVKEHGPEVTGMQEDISENAEAIAGVAGRMDTAEGKISGLETAVSTKVEQSAFDEVVEGLEGADTALAGRIATLEGKFGGADGSVEDMIEDAKQAAIDAAAADATDKADAAEAAAKQYTDDEIDKVEATIAEMQAESAKHAMASDLTALTGRVTTAESEIDTLQSEMDAVEALADANKAAHEANAAAILLKADKTAMEDAEGRLDQVEADIEELEGVVADKAEQEALDAAVARIAKNEENIAAVTSAVAGFTAITAEEVEKMFA